MDRLLRAPKQNPDKLTVLDRLAIVGKSGMGALTYYPEKKIDEQYGNSLVSLIVIPHCVAQHE